MSPINLGTTPINGCYKGNVAISAIYRGTALVWQKILAPTTTQIPVFPYVHGSTSKSQSSGTGGATAKTHPKPPGVAAGDLLVFYIVQDYGAITAMTAPSGFTTTSIAGVTSELKASGTNMVLHGVYYKVADTSDASATSYTFGMTSDADGASMMLVVKDWDGNTSNISFAMLQTTKTAKAIPTVTPKASPGLVLFSAAHDSNAGGSFLYDWVAPQDASLAGKAQNATNWSGMGAASEIIKSTSAISGRTWIPSNLTAAPAPVITTAMTLGGKTTTATALAGEYSGGSNGALTDRENQQFTDSQNIQHNYHIYAADLDWTKDVGIIIYTDGSGEYGLIGGLATDYLLNGPQGLRAVAKKHNMLLLTPMAPGGPCADGDGVCWYDNSPSTNMTPAQKYQWSKELIELIYSQYNISKSRVAVGGYSSGAQWTTQFFTPADAHRFMTDGVLVPIAYGGVPKVASVSPPEFKENVQMVWDVGELDTSYTGLAPTWADGIVEGEQWYRDNGYKTRITVVGGIGHFRYVDTPDLGEYGRIMDKYITMYVRSSTPVAGSSGGGGGGGTPAPTQTSYYSGGMGGSSTNLVGQSYVKNGTTSTYNLYVQGLDWSKNVGIMIYTDGSDEFGLKNPTQTYLLAGSTGLIATAQKHNMILLTPLAPGNGCLDGEGTCWYEPSLDGTSIEAKIAWCYELVKDIYTKYNIDKRRVAIGGYSSGAQWTTQFFGPKHAPEFMVDGVAVPISYGGMPVYTSTYTDNFKAHVPFRWVTGDQDTAWSQPTWDDGIQEGMQWYKDNNFNTAVRLLQGVGHTGTEITGKFGGFMDVEISAHVTPSLVPTSYAGSSSSGSGGNFVDQNAVAFSTSSYHIRAAHLAGKTGPFPVIFHWHGDGAEEYTAPTTSTLPAYAAEAVKQNAILIVARTPDNTQPVTWWEDTASVTYSVNLMTEIFNKYPVDKKRVFLSGYSGGAELISFNHLVDYHTMFEGGGAMMLGGGGVVYDEAGNKVAFTGTPTQSLKDQFFLNWEVGDGDNGVAPSDTTIDALTSSTEGEEMYRLAGFKTERNIIKGVNHFTSEPYGPARLTNLINKSNMYYGLPTV